MRAIIALSMPIGAMLGQLYLGSNAVLINVYSFVP
jgi:hypothetical protein